MAGHWKKRRLVVSTREEALLVGKERESVYGGVDSNLRRLGLGNPIVAGRERNTISSILRWFPRTKSVLSVCCLTSLSLGLWASYVAPPHSHLQIAWSTDLSFLFLFRYLLRAYGQGFILGPAQTGLFVSCKVASSILHLQTTVIFVP